MNAQAVRMLGDVTAVSGLWYFVALASVLATTALWVRLQSVVARLRAAQASSRWASNVRDLIGLAGFATLVLAFHLCGIPVAAGVLFAGMMGVLLELLRLGKGSRPARTMAVALAFAAVIAVWPSDAVESANRVVSALFSGQSFSRPS